MLAAGCDNVNLAFLIDSSGSIVGTVDTWANIQDFVTRVIARLNIGPNLSQVAVLQFASTVQIIFPFFTYDTPADMYSAVDNSSPLTTNTDTALGLR